MCLVLLASPKLIQLKQLARAPHGRRRRRPVPPNHAFIPVGRRTKGPPRSELLMRRARSLRLSVRLALTYPKERGCRQAPWVTKSGRPPLVYSRGPKGTVELNQIIRFLRQRFGTGKRRARTPSDQVRHVVMEVYKDLAIAHVAHVRNYAGCAFQILSWMATASPICFRRLR